MIYFITKEEWHLNHYREKLYDNIEVLEDNKESLMFYKEWVNNQEGYIGFDTETNGLDCYYNDSLLYIIGNKETQFVLHSPFISLLGYMQILQNRNITLLGQNIKFDIKVLYSDTGIWYRHIYDTMIAEQRLYMKLGIKSGLEDLYIRYLNKYPDNSDKSIRNEFINCNVTTFKVRPRHIYYGAGDVDNLFEVKDKQLLKIENYNLGFLLFNIEFPMTPIIAKAEFTGFRFDKKKWLKIYEENKDKCFSLEQRMDDEVRTLRDTIYSEKNSNPLLRVYMTGGKWDNIRKHNPIYDIFNDDGTTNNLDLFGEPMKINTLVGSKAKVAKKIQSNPNNLNYNSDTQIIEIFGRLQEPLLNKEETLVIPTFTKAGKINKTVHSYKTNEPSFRTYLTLLPETRMKPFIEMLLEHRGLSKAISTYGSNFINHINKITGNLHTEFGQCFTATGRMSSGGGKKQPDKPNLQNIPSKAEYAIAMRNCFLAKHGYSIGTHDLSGAELIIMCSLSQDFKLLEIAKQDIHSYVAEGCWRLIYKHRANQLIKYWYGKPTPKDIQEKIKEYVHLSNIYIVDKTKPKIRTAFKPMTFGTIYGMYAGKAAKTLNITKEEGQIVIDFIKREFPDVFSMVEQAVANASKKGFLILNSRTHSRAWFPNIIRVLQGKLTEKEAFKLISKEQSEARNIRIQGTQADMIKECTVELQRWIDINNFTDDITILSWVHDEIVDEHPTYLDGNSEEAWEWLQKGNFLTYNDIKYPSFPRVKAQIMRDTCNKYLHNVQMDVDYDIMPYWTK